VFISAVACAPNGGARIPPEWLLQSSRDRCVASPCARRSGLPSCSRRGRRRGRKNPRLIVIDVLAMFRPRSGNRDNLYEADYHAIQGLQALAGELNVAIAIVHHVRKSGSDVDPFEKVSGTLGLSGAADAVLIVDKDSKGETLYGRGRDVEEIEKAVSFDRLTCRWTILGRRRTFGAVMSGKTSLPP
jgi:hypothetical protein